MNRTSEIADQFDAVVRDRTDAVLLIAPTENQAYTAGDIDTQARDLRRRLRRTGLTAGHLVVAAAGNRAAIPALVLALLREGLPLMPVDHSTPLAELVALAGRWDAAALIVGDRSDLTEALASAGPAVPAFTRTPLGHGLAAWVASPVPAPGRHAPAVLLKLTSGSTGAPRATCTEERHLIADVRHIVGAMDIGVRDRQLGVIPLSHSYGFSNLLLPLLWQGTPLLLRPQFVPTQIASDVRGEALTTFAGVPFMFDHLATHHQLPRLDTLRLVVSAGARLGFDTVAAFHRVSGLKVRSFYGSSETGGICFDESRELDPRVPVGRAMGETRLTLVDDEDAPAGSGRVEVRGPNVIDRYAVPARQDGNGDAPATGDGGVVANGTFLTGDYARVDADGRVVLTGRVASFVNVAGRKVHPGEVEAALRSLPGVEDAVAVGIADAVRGQALGAALQSTAAWDARSVREALSTRLAPFKLPRAVIVMRTLPLTDRGKLDRAALVRLLERRD